MAWRSFAYDGQSGTLHLHYETGEVGENKDLAKPILATVSVRNGITYIRLRDDGRPPAKIMAAVRFQGCATVVLPKGVPSARVRDEARPGATPRLYDVKLRTRLLSGPCPKVPKIQLSP